MLAGVVHTAGTENLGLLSIFEQQKLLFKLLESLIWIARIVGLDLLFHLIYRFIEQLFLAAELRLVKDVVISWKIKDFQWNSARESMVLLHFLCGESDAFFTKISNIQAEIAARPLRAGSWTYYVVAPSRRPPSIPKLQNLIRLTTNGRLRPNMIKCRLLSHAHSSQ